MTYQSTSKRPGSRHFVRKGKREKKVTQTQKLRLQDCEMREGEREKSYDDIKRRVDVMQSGTDT